MPPATLAAPARAAPALRRARLRRHAARTLAAAATSPATAPPARVAIVGAGVGGLSLALALQRLCPATKEITLFESEADVGLDRGAAFNLNGGAAVLHDLGIDLSGMANPMERVLGRTVGGTRLLDVSIAGALAGHETELYRNGRSCAVTVLRQDLQRALLAAAVAPGQGKARLRVGSAVVSASASAEGATLTLADGTTTEAYDLVIGADGLRSRVRPLVCGAAAPAAPLYSGIRIAFGVVPRAASAADALRPRPAEVHQWFAPGAYTLCFSAGLGAQAAASSQPAAEAGAHCLALCWQDASPTGENASWDATAVQAATLRRLEAGGFPKEVKDLAAAATRFFEIGVCFHAPLPEGAWAHPSGRATLLGDACHAMPPFLGQGANQAIQDAYALASRLAAIGTDATPTLSAALAAYEATRRPPTAALQVSSRAIGLLDTLQAPWHPIRDLALFIAGATGIAGKVFVNGALPRV